MTTDYNSSTAAQGSKPVVPCWMLVLDCWLYPTWLARCSVPCWCGGAQTSAQPLQVFHWPKTTLGVVKFCSQAWTVLWVIRVDWVLRVPRINTRFGQNLIRVFNFVTRWICSGNGLWTKWIRVWVFRVTGFGLEFYA